MKHKIKYQTENKGETLSSEEMKKYLSSLEAQISQGSIDLGGNSVETAGPYFFKSRARVKDGRLEYQISFKADLTGVENSKRPEDKRWKSVKKSSFNRKEAEGIKKEMKALWKEIVPRIEAGESPGQEVSQQMLKLFADYEDWVEEDWKESWYNCKLKLERCLTAADNGADDEAGQLMAEIKGLISDCHNRYK